MARKRKVHHRRSRSRRRVGAVNMASVGKRVLGVAGGAFACRTINNMVVKQMPTLSQTMIGAGDAVLGFIIPKFLKGDIGQGVGDAFLTIGSLTVLQSVNAISGMGAMPRRIATRVVGATPGTFLSKTVGAAPRQFINKGVGAARGSAYARMEQMNRNAMGRLGHLGSLSIEE